MGGIFRGCGTLGLVLLVAGGLLAAYLVHAGRGLDAGGRAYAEESLGAVTGHWDAAALEARASPELLEATPSESLEGLFARLAVLGALIADPRCQGQAFVSEVVGQARVTTARYMCDALYAAGPAKVEMNLVQQGGAWKISGFHVNSDALLHPRAGVRL